VTRRREQLTENLGDESFAEQLRRGRAMTLDEALTYAREALDEATPVLELDGP
jgi:hypothetical protein